MRRRPDDSTLDLFVVPRAADPLPGSHDCRVLVCELVASALKQCVDDRYAVAASMSRLTGRDVSKYMLDAYSSPAREEFNLPLYLAPAFEATCRTHVLSSWLAEIRGGRLMIGRDALNAELGRLEKMRDDAAVKIKEIKKQMNRGESNESGST
jgi:hypothetical protein